MVKKALCIGINYSGTSTELKGCINDAIMWKNFYESKNYIVELMVDDPSYNTEIPTRKNILASINTLVSNLKDGDYVVFTYSGHGSHIHDSSGDENYHQDETICPSDFITSGMITDDDLHKHLLVPLPQKCTFLGLMDCCHSGTSLDLQYIGGKSQIKEYKKIPIWIWNGWYGWILGYKYIVDETVTANTRTDIQCENAIMFSGCQDTQTAADAIMDNKYVGAFSYCMYKTLQSSLNTSKYDASTKCMQVNNLLKENNFKQIVVYSTSRPQYNYFSI